MTKDYIILAYKQITVTLNYTKSHGWLKWNTLNEVAKSNYKHAWILPELNAFM
jgi:hypothetical protein